MLYEDMRPKTLKEVIGNDHIKSNISTAIALSNLPHTLLITGPFGTGKTTLARIIATELDAEYLEHDCGAQGDIDTIKSIVENGAFGSMFSAAKVIVLDEVHKLSQAAQTVLLKPLENPRPGVFWIMCTSEPDKLLASLKSRAVQYTLEPVTVEGLRVATARLLEKQQIKLEGGKADWGKVIEASEGNYRRFYTIMESIYGAAGRNGTLSTDAVNKILGVTEDEEIDESMPIIQAFNLKKVGEVLKACESIRKSKGESGAYPTLMGLYNYLRKVTMNNPTPARAAALMELGETLSRKELATTWYGVETALMRALIKLTQ